MSRSLVIDQVGEELSAQIKEIPEKEFEQSELLVKVEYSTINYKDGMVLNGLGKLVNSYPHIPGIDACGTVLASRAEEFSVGDRVILGGHRFGEICWGGYSELVGVESSMAVRLPDGLSPRDAMALGTAGLSAMLAINALESFGLEPSDKEVLVTGAVGGVGSIAVALLSKLGYRVAGSTGRSYERPYLEALGASTIIDREELEEPSTRPLEKERWSACIDNVGGATLSRVLRQMSHASSIASVGLAGGSNFEGTVMPFLLRGVNILGIDSVSVPQDSRFKAWQRLADLFPPQILGKLIEEIDLDQVTQYGNKILKGQIKGRIVVKL